MAGLLSVDGGTIPTRSTQCGSTVTPIGSGADDTANIQNAINACPTGEYVNLASGAGAASYSGYISGTTLTITSAVTGTIAAHQVISGSGIYPGTVILSGSGTSWTVSWSQTAGSSGSPISISNTTPFTIAEGHTVHVNAALTLRGAGPGNTILMHPPGQDTTNNGCNSPGAWGATINSECPGNSPSPVVSLGGTSPSTTTTALTADGTQGSSSVTVSSTSGISAGTIVLVDELANSTYLNDCCFNSGGGTVFATPAYQVEWNAHTPSVGSWDSGPTSNTFTGNGDACDYSFRCGGVHEELHQVTSVSGNTITFDTPLTLTYHVANSAEVWVISGMVQQAGLENLTVAYGDNGNISNTYCAYCWNYKIDSLDWLNGGILLWQGAFRNQLDTFWVHNAAWPVNGGAGYCLSLTYGASENLIWNGISDLCNKEIVVRASSNNVVAYNYMSASYINGNHSWAETGLNFSHLAGSHGNLAEGNQAEHYDNDFTHGNSTYNTVFGNDLTGFRDPFVGLDGFQFDDAAGCCGPLRAIGDHPYMYDESFVGNVAGSAGQMFSWNHNCQGGPADSGCAPAVYNLGWTDYNGSGSEPDATMAVTYPTQPSGTITGSNCISNNSSWCVPIVDGNFDYQTDAIQWASNDSAHTLPNSFFLSAKPAFFNAGSGYPWPWVTPTSTVPIQNGPTSGTCSAANYDSTNSASANVGIGSISGGGSYTWTLPHAIPAGETAIFTLFGGPNNGTSTTAANFAAVTDNASTYDSWRQLGYAVGNNRYQWAVQQYVVLKSNGASTITIHANANSGGLQYMSGSLAIFMNVNAIDGSSAHYQEAPGTGANAITSGNLIALYAGDLIYSALNSAESYTSAAGTGFTAGQSSIDEYILSSAGTGTKTATFTATSGSGGDEWVTAAVALRCSNTLSPLPARARYDDGTPFSQP